MSFDRWPPHFIVSIFLLEKSLGFVFKEILITQTWRKPKKSHKHKQGCGFSHKNNAYLNPDYLKIEFGDRFSWEKWIRRVLKSFHRNFKRFWSLDQGRSYYLKLWQYWTQKILYNFFFCFRTASLGGSELMLLVATSHNVISSDILKITWPNPLFLFSVLILRSIKRINFCHRVKYFNLYLK